MFPVGVHTLRIVVVGEDRITEALSGWETDTGVSLDVDAMSPAAADDDVDHQRTHCLVLDGASPGVDGRTAVEERATRADVPVVLLTEQWEGGRVGDALSSGAADVLPAKLVESDPELLAERVVAAVDRDYRSTSLRDLFDDVNDGICLYDPWAEELLDVNETMTELTGYSRETLLERGVDAFSSTADGYTRERLYEVQKRVAETGEPETVDWKIETNDGDHRLLEADLTPTTVAGDPRVVTISRDVTARRELEETYRGIFENVSDGLVVHHPETGEIRDVNQRFCEMNGYDREALIGETLDLITAPNHPYERTQERIQAARDEGPQLFEWRNQRADGETFPVEVNLRVVEIQGEERVLGSVRDITERKRREREYAQIFDGVSSPITVNDPETGEIIDVNEAMCELLGYDREEILGRTIPEISVTEKGDTSEDAREAVRRVMESGETETLEWQLETAGGEHRWLEVKATPAEIGGEKRFLAISRDVTAHRRTERQLSEILDRIDEAIYLTPVRDLTRASQSPDYLSSGYEEIWGHPLDRLQEMYENGFFDTLHPDDEATYREFIEGIVHDVETDSAADSYTQEYRITRPDGEVRWVHSEYYPLAWERGPRRIVIVSRDVTDRKRTERNLRLIARRVDEAIYMSSPDKREVYYASPSFEDLWDMSTERIYEDPQAFLDRVHPEDREWFREEYDRIRRDLTAPDREPQDTYELEYRVRHDDGEVRWISVRGYPVFDGGGGVDRWIAVNRDVTERKARERRIASFDDATEDLASADTPEEATETAVTAATETLNLSAVGAFLYDDDDGVLRAEALAGPLPAAVTTDPIGPDDGPLWEAFATGTVVTSEREGDGGVAEDTADGTLDDLAAWRAVALGNHGALLVGSPADSFGSETIQAAHILAATLEAALNHLQGQQQLAAQEEQLRTQTERAERLDRIAQLTQQVEAAITDASTPRNVERAVCERLTSSGPYDLAWIGGIEVGSDRLTHRVVGGVRAQYVEQMALITTDDTADPHPAVTAWQTGEIRVVDSLVDTGPTGEWRHHALSAGFQSLCAVPLTYDGITHGVLTIGTDTPRAFGDREREVLAQLGTSIANSLAAIERRRALESDETVELEFRGPGDSLPFARAASAADCRVRLERTAARQDGSVSIYFSFEGDVPADVSAIARRTLPGTVDVVAESSSTLVEARTDDWFGAPLAEYGGMLRDAAAEPDETEVRVEVPKQADVRSFVERLQDIAPSLELVARRQHRQRDRTPTEASDRIRTALTDRQLEVVQTALSAGYFEWPREHDGSEVAARLGITQPTFNKHLRIAERETFTLLFDERGDA